MKTIILSDILSSRNDDAISAGTDLYTLIAQQVSTGEKLVVDMTGTTSLSSVFLNVSIGKIIDEFGESVVKNTVSFTNITQQQAKRLSEYLTKYCSPK